MALYMKTRSSLNQKMEISYQLRERVFRTISEHNLIEKGDTVIAGVSGGADSVCLLFLLLDLKERLSIDVTALHVEHGIRGESSRCDAGFVEKLCKEHDIPFQMKEVDAPGYAKEHKVTLEEAARLLRYGAFFEAAKQFNEKRVKIAVAHHRDDQAETVLFQMARGSGLRGLGGMHPKRDCIIRPLLNCSRRDLELYLIENELPYRTDETNRDNQYARNRIRNVILPELKEIQPGCIDHIAAAAGELQEIDAYIKKQAGPVYEQIAKWQEGCLRIGLGDFDALDPVIKKEIVRMAIGEFIPAKKDILRRHIESIVALADKENGKELHLPQGVLIKKTEHALVFQKGEWKNTAAIQTGPWILLRDQKTEQNVDPEVLVGSECTLKSRIFPYRNDLTIPEDTYTKWLDYDRIKNGLLIRTRRSGDYLCIDDAGHKKSLQDYFVNNKIPADIRDQVLLLADGDHVVWIPGYRISTQYKITDQTENVIELQITGGLS